MSEKSVQTRSEASCSSRASEARQKAALAQLHLSQARRANELERQQVEKKMELKRRVEQLEMELKKHVERLEQQELELETERKLHAMADHVEECELQARLIEEEENGGVHLHPKLQDERGPQPQATPVNPREAFGTDQVRLTADDAGRTARWVSDHNLERIESSPKVTDSRITWIDALEDNGQGSDCTVQTRGVGMRLGPLPPLTLEKFVGDPLQWPRWIALFKALVHDRSELSNAERLAHLQSSLAGPAQLAVSGLLYDGSLYNEALRELQSQFGDRAIIVRASLNNVLQLPNVQHNDIPSLTELSRVLHSTVSVLTSLNYDADLAASTNVTAIVAKLPTSLAWKWGEHLQTILHREPTLSDLDRWLRTQVAAARAVVTTAAAQTDGGGAAKRSEWDHKVIPQDRPTGVLATTATLPTDKVGAEQCRLCEGAHSVEHCGKLTRLSVDERVTFLMKRAMCFRCLEPGHRARECTSMRKCSVSECASSRHHRLLHGMKEINRYLTRADESTTKDAQLVGAASVKRKNQTLLQIVPVVVHGPRGKRKVNALLDMGSEISLIKDDIASQVGLEGPVESLKIGTVDGSKTRSSRRVNFQIQSLISEERFQVAAARTTPLINVSGHAINWPKEKLKWRHLADLNLQRTTSEEIEVLLGMDSFSLIVPREVREGHPGSPAAVYTRLGWVASGRLPGSDEQDGIASQVNSVQETDDEQQQVEVKESYETMQDELCRSNDDEQTLKVIKGSMAPADDRRDMRPAWKRPAIEVPDSGPAALTRLVYAKRDSTEADKWQRMPESKPRPMKPTTDTQLTGYPADKAAVLDTMAGPQLDLERKAAVPSRSWLLAPSPHVDTRSETTDDASARAACRCFLPEATAPKHRLPARTDGAAGAAARNE